MKIATKLPGIYKVDVAMLVSLGINNSIPSTAIRLFGNGGSMLPENCSGDFTDDLTENAIQLFDGGDGIFNGNDYFLFYSSGPDKWLNDSINHRFRHQKNLYDNQSFYFITLAGAGKRIISQTIAPTTTRRSTHLMSVLCMKLIPSTSSAAAKNGMEKNLPAVRAIS